MMSCQRRRDVAPASVLTFLARRLPAEPFFMVAALRDGHRSDLSTSGLDELRLSRFDDVAARALLQQLAPSLGSATGERTLQAAEGNPLALIEPPATVEDSATPPAWLTTPSWFLISRDDQAIPVHAQRVMATRAGGTGVEINASHLVLISQPDAVARLIRAASR